MGLMDMLRNPGWQASAFPALGDASANPYANPIMEMVLSGRQGFDAHQAAEAERLKKEEEERRRRDAEDRQRQQKQQALMLQLGVLGNDPAKQAAIMSAYPDLVQGLQAGWAEAAAGRAAEEATAEEGFQVLMHSITDDDRRQQEALRGGGQEATANKILQQLFTPEKEQRQSPFQALRFGDDLHRFDPNAGTLSTLLEGEPDAAKGATESQVRLRLNDIEKALSSEDAFGVKQRPTWEQVTKVYEQRWGPLAGGGPRARADGAEGVDLPPEVRQILESQLAAGMPWEQVRQMLKASSVGQVDIGPER